MPFRVFFWDAARGVLWCLLPGAGPSRAFVSQRTPSEAHQMEFPCSVGEQGLSEQETRWSLA